MIRKAKKLIFKPIFQKYYQICKRKISNYNKVAVSIFLAKFLKLKQNQIKSKRDFKKNIFFKFFKNFVHAVLLVVSLCPILIWFC